MKATSLRLLQGFLIAGCAAAENAYLYTLDIKPRQLSSSISSSIDSETANAILTRRLGGTESTRLGPVDNLRLEHLNNYGGQQTLQLFGDETSASASDRLIIAIEGYDGEPLTSLRGITVDRPDTSLANLLFVEDLITGDLKGSSPCSRDVSLRCGMKANYVSDSKGGPCMEKDEIVRMLGEDTHAVPAGDPKAIQGTLNSHGGRGSTAFMRLDMTRMANISPETRNAAIKAILSNFYEALAPLSKAGKAESTILLLPSQRVPPTRNLNRRQTPEDFEEEPLFQPFDSVSSASSVTSPEKADTTPSNSSHGLPPLGSYLPACFLHESNCTEKTNSCSGHGSCYAKSKKCFACKCGSTVVRHGENGENSKTVQWGGTACERKDVSVPFFLFAGFGIFMTAMVVGVVGMMYSMGSEELPSVIGAGVTGPRAQS